ncbi:MAG: hypothetical protein LBQ01_04115 [Prevotellaceae bacterium]|jgi:hypothetical protein|nr:hypothetical protein [Prevotellaceae bacterium]
MGTGIMGGIPLSFRFGSLWGGYSKKRESEYKELFIEHAPKDFFDFYNEELCDLQTGEKSVTVTEYVIKPEILLPNFKDYFYKFHELIGDAGDPDGYKKFETKYNDIVASNDLDKFIEYFDDDTGYAPTIFPYFGPAYIVVIKNMLIYQGSYKTMMEEESSLLHMERLLWAAMDHPLAKVTRIGMSL